MASFNSIKSSHKFVKIVLLLKNLLFFTVCGILLVVNHLIRLFSFIPLFYRFLCPRTNFRPWTKNDSSMYYFKVYLQALVNSRHKFAPTGGLIFVFLVHRSNILDASPFCEVQAVIGKIRAEFTPKKNIPFVSPLMTKEFNFSFPSCFEQYLGQFL